MTKDELRKLYLDKRRSLSDSEHALLSKTLCDSFFLSVDLSAIRVVHLFLPIRKNREPDTFLILDRMRREFPGVQLSIPRVNPQSGLLENFFWEGADQIKENTWGIPEPIGGNPTPAEMIDLVLVPLLAFDLAGHRVGYGRGYYDRFLSACRFDCKKVGLSFFPPVVEIASDEHDQKLDMAITPGKEYSF